MDDSFLYKPYRFLSYPRDWMDADEQEPGLRDHPGCWPYQGRTGLMAVVMCRKLRGVRGAS